jgi:hypothetical protein
VGDELGDGQPITPPPVDVPPHPWTRFGSWATAYGILAARTGYRRRDGLPLTPSRSDPKIESSTESPDVPGIRSANPRTVSTFAASRPKTIAMIR